MIDVIYEKCGSMSYALGEVPVLPDVPVSISLPTGYQVIIYENENFRGNSVVLDAHDAPKDFDISGTVCARPLSMRVMSNIEVLPGHKRDALAVEDALHGSGWLQKSILQTPERIKWMVDAKFGCFVHWGVYAIAGGEWNGRTIGYSEHIQRAAQITMDDYKKHFIDQFNPVDFNADEWIKLVKDAGMKYFVITAKHHDGFAMNHSDVCNYNISMTPFDRDPIAELSQACRRYGIPFGMYYSHAFDWGHPDAPGNDWEYTNGGGDKHLFEGEKGLWFDQHPELVPRTIKYYVDKKSIPQILELIKKYKPALLWFDTPHKLPTSENLRILKAIREADPTIVVNGRLVNNSDFPSFADYVNTADKAAEIFPTPGVWETIPTTNESYGYSKIDKTHKPPEHFIELLVKAIARGGNVLMNVGPTEYGTIDDIDKDILLSIGSWLSANGESIYGTSRSPMPVQTFGETTLKGNKLYLHFFKPQENAIILAGMINPVSRAYVLTDNTKTPLATKRLNYYDTQIDLPHNLPAYTVVAVEFEGELLTDGRRLVNGTTPEYLRAFDATHISAELSHGDGKRWREYVEGFTNAEQQVVWQVRVHKKTAYKLAVHYSTSEKCSGTYSIYANGVKHTKAISPDCPISPLWYPNEPFTEEFNIELDGTKDIVFRPEVVDGIFLRLHGISLIPEDKEFNEAINIGKDTTDVGGYA